MAALVAATLVAGLTLATTAPAAAQAVGNDRNVRAEDIPMQPLRDLNIDSEDIPPLLIDIANDPYSADGLVTCQDIERAIADIDAMLGPDIDAETERSDMQKGANSAGRIASSVVGGLIPFRGIVRELSGARAHERYVRQVVAAGMVRRGFLKGLGLERDCAWPARPADARVEFHEDMHDAIEAGSDFAPPPPPPSPRPPSQSEAPPPSQAAAPKPRYVTQPVVQRAE